MNYALFYKLIKEAGTVGSGSVNPTTDVMVNPGSLTTIPSQTASPATQPSQTTPSISTQGLTSTPAAREVTTSPGISSNPSLSSSVPNPATNPPQSSAPTTSVPTTQAVPRSASDLTAEQLAEKWIQDKERFYQNKATKYPQYANWHVSPQTREKTYQQAQEMLRRNRAKAWSSYNQTYDPAQNVYRDEAARYATGRGYKRLQNEKRKAQEEAQNAQQQAAMQNPTATFAMPNPAPTAGNVEANYDQVVNAYERGWYDTYAGPATRQATSDARRSLLRPLLPGVADWQLNNMGWDYYNTAPTGRVGEHDLPMLQRMYTEAEQNPAILNFIKNEDGSWCTPREVAQKAARMAAEGEAPPAELKPFWQYLLSVNNRFPA